ncbi:MAG: urease accessory protein UreF [Alphaproteobacteria bacterium]|nr:urease accessory protein UreF [Alphaproteobacteria bacterium]MBU0798127.1 urease accessory protein UreF [Alphaproteobacteria bacterium]MBU0887056.1 urease accessory protein UreF [Alphaproteobacteria bacterium]MBU1814306.1 urease accessory protein UreF [Alphaproteobacteria bacterium]MBU2090037.1 urease accessory protein UreF [Alphaproteobacteria bacterium]
MDMVMASTTTEATLYRLMTWLTPSFPVGAFSYSHGLEWAVESGDIRDLDSLTNWLSDLLAQGSGRNDAILLAEAWRAAMASDWQRLADICELALALSPARERHLETAMQGRSFASAIATSWPCAAISELQQRAGTAIAYPVAVGAASAGHGLPLEPVVAAYLHGFVANLVSAGVRLIPLGQTDGQRALVALEGPVGEAARQAIQSDLDDLGAAMFRADIAAMKHETQYTRLFRS